MRSHLWGEERNILYKGVETSLSQTLSKNLEEKLERESSNKIISASSELELLQMVSEPNFDLGTVGYGPTTLPLSHSDYLIGVRHRAEP